MTLLFDLWYGQLCMFKISSILGRAVVQFLCFWYQTKPHMFSYSSRKTVYVYCYRIFLNLLQNRPKKFIGHSVCEKII